MKTLTPLILLAAATAACTASPPPEQAVAAGGVSCLPGDQVIARHLAAPNTIDFEMVGGKTYRNQLASKCVSLERLGSTAIVGVTSAADPARVCAGDRVKIFDPVEVKATGLRGEPYCQLGQFTAMRTP